MNEEAEARVPQIALVSSAADREYIRPLVHGLRGRGVDVWWDADAIMPGEEWEPKTWAVLRSAPITCVLVSAASLRSRNLQRAIDVVLGAGRLLVPIQVARVDPRTLPPELEQRERVTFLESADLDGAVGALERTVRTVTASGEQSAGRGTTADSSNQAAHEGTGPSTISLRFGDEPTPETWTVGTELKRTIEEAIRLRGKGSIESQFPVSFSTLLTAVFSAGGTWSQWAHGVAKASGFDRTKLRPLPVPGTEVSRSNRTTTSAARILRSARSFAERSGVTPDVQHLIAAYVYEPAGHERDLEIYGFNRFYWANALIEEVGRRSPADGGVFTALRDAVLPITPAPNTDSPATPDAGEQDAEWRFSASTWASLDDGLKKAFAWAVAINSATAAEHPINVRDLFAGLVRLAPPESDQWKDMVACAAALAAGEGQPPWRPVWGALGLPDVPDEPPPVAALPPRAPEVDAVLAQTKAVQVKLGMPPEPLIPAGVMLAFFTPRPAGEPAAIDALLPALGLDADEYLRRLQESDAGRTDLYSVAVLQEIRVARGAFRPWNRPHVDNDQVGGPISPDKDLLDARRPALRFAKLLAARDIHPPIALGLFGNWGSGKTFFMGLMRNRIADLAATGDTEYVRRVVQIEFNAWHYHDTNLWASLAIRIFEGLARELAGNKESEIEATRKALHQKLRSSEARRQEAETRRTTALTRRATLAEALEAKRTERAEKEKESVRRRLEAAWQVMTEGEVFAGFRAALGQLSEQFGITAAVASAEDLRRLQHDIDQTSERAFGLFSAIGHRFDGLGRTARTVALLVLVAASALALGRGFDRLAEILQVTLPQFSSTVLEVSALVSAVAAWCGRRVAQIRGAVEHIAKVEVALAAAERTVEPIELKSLQDEIAGLDKEIHQAGEELSASEREIADATAEIDRINRGGLVYDFLQERQASASYVGQLGLISTIRQDFDRLGKLLRDFEAQGTDPIERIVLYVDDLDRCHPDKVVEVLQAVHLLLAFNLFNVVVGVDARWLERSLRRQYVGGGAGPSGHDAFSPQDYLEKIFQIPYALGRIDATGFKQLVGGLIETRSDHAKKQRERAETAKEKEREQQARSAAAETTVDAGSTSGGGTAASNVDGGVGHVEAAHDRQPDAVHDSPKDTAAKTDAGTSSVTPALYFEDHEESFIQLLYEFIDRPRLAKRFINIYRLLRVRADDEGESTRFAASATSAEYRAALTLLAVQVGHPTVAAALTDALEHHPGDRTWPELLGALAEGQLADAVSPAARRDIGVVAAKLARIGARVPAEIDPYRRWAPRVACYSFAWHGATPEGGPLQVPSLASTTPSVPESPTT